MTMGTLGQHEYRSPAFKSRGHKSFVFRTRRGHKEIKYASPTFKRTRFKNMKRAYRTVKFVPCRWGLKETAAPEKEKEVPQEG